jgi:DnaK suppressor protein
LPLALSRMPFPPMDRTLPSPWLQHDRVHERETIYNVGPSPQATDGMDPEKARDLLTRERERIERELTDLRTARDGGDGELADYDQHNADAGTELFEEERDQSLIRRMERDIEAIDRAFKRIDEGTYGVSVESGEPIPEQRLELLPWAERTVEEQARLDAESRNG